MAKKCKTEPDQLDYSGLFEIRLTRGGSRKGDGHVNITAAGGLVGHDGTENFGYPPREVKQVLDGSGKILWPKPKAEAK